MKLDSLSVELVLKYFQNNVNFWLEKPIQIVRDYIKSMFQFMIQLIINKLSQGTYKYYVADYTNCSQNNYSSMDMLNSFARVDVYTKNELTVSFTVPNNREEVIWNVFNISNGK